MKQRVRKVNSWREKELRKDGSEEIGDGWNKEMGNNCLSGKSSGNVDNRCFHKTTRSLQTPFMHSEVPVYMTPPHAVIL